MGNFVDELRAEMGKFPDKESYIEGMVFSPIWHGDTPSSQGLDKRRQYLEALWEEKPQKKPQEPMTRRQDDTELRIQEAIWRLEKKSATLSLAVRHLSEIDFTDEVCTEDLDWEELCDALDGMKEQADALYQEIKNLSRKYYSVFGPF